VLGTLKKTIGRWAADELRAHPSAQGDPVLKEWFGGKDTASGEIYTPTQAMRFSAIYACINMLSETLRVLPLHLYQRSATGSRKRVRVDDHPVAQMFRHGPNPHMDKGTFKYLMMRHMLVHGQSFWEQERDGGGRLRGLWPLAPDRVRVVVDRRTPTYLFDAFTGEGGRAIQRQNMLHVFNQTSNGWTGVSPLQEVLESVGSYIATEKLAATYFKNNAVPQTILFKKDRPLSPEARKRITAELEDAHRGVENSHKFAMLQEPFEIKQLGLTLEQAQMIEARQFTTVDMARIFNLPPHMIQDLTHATFSNIEQQSINYVVYSVQPWLSAIENVINKQLLLMNEQDEFFCEFSVEGLLRGDVAARGLWYQQMILSGVMSRNEVRDLENMNPIDGLDEMLVPMNMGGANDEPSKGPEQDGDAKTRRATDINTLEFRELAALPMAEARGAYETRAKNRLALRDQYRPIIREQYGRLVRREVDAIGKAVKQFMNERSEADFLKWLDSYAEDLPKQYRDLLETTMRGYMDATAKTALEEVGVQGVDMDDFFEDYIRVRAETEAAKLANEIRAVMDVAAENGKDPSAEIKGRLEEWLEKKADKFAENETIRANSAAAREAMERGGVVRLRWVAVGKNCPLCASLDGQIVGVRQAFVNKGSVLNPGGANSLTAHQNVLHSPLHRGCDCFVSQA